MEVVELLAVEGSHLGANTKRVIRVHPEMQSTWICKVGLGLPNTKMPTSHQNLIIIRYYISDNTNNSLLVRLIYRRIRIIIF